MNCFFLNINNILVDKINKIIGKYSNISKILAENDNDLKEENKFYIE